ncbi:hypothetical protein CcCBS67573_g03743 [Chytriomyces confervae]|uniref:Uncharacterized protein n=1 Tax=Chytriomyces confervae TaxID=246404 RepID=A0A507FF51_9FUNG|nr:hypothetical protein HDU80_002972 [Chytriomyces hyalinus]TPX74979.1 hypothetical protein CcCBS67573_g03743 [Chytriomyces confervae]
MTSRPTSANRSVSKSRLQSASTPGSTANSGIGSLPSAKVETSTTNSRTTTRPPSAQPQPAIKPKTSGSSKPSTRPTSAVGELVPKGSNSKPTSASSKPPTRPVTAVAEAVQSTSKRTSIANRTTAKTVSRPATGVKFEAQPSTIEAVELTAAVEETPLDLNQPFRSTTATPKPSASRNASRPETARKQLDQEPGATPSNSKSRPETASKKEGQQSRPETAHQQIDQESASTPSNSKSRPETASKKEGQPETAHKQIDQESASTPSNSKSRPETASKKEGQKSRPETALKQIDQESASTPSNSKSRPETASKKEEQPPISIPSNSKSRPETASIKEEQAPSSTRVSKLASTKSSRPGTAFPASEQASPAKSRPTTTPKSARPLTATSKSVVNEDTLYPLSGRWAGWYCKDKPRKDAADECKSYNLSIACQADGTAVCKSLVKEGSTVVKGSFKDTNIELSEPSRLHYPVLITASLHNGTEELVGNWKMVTDPSVSGHLELHRLCPATSNPGGLFISGQYFGTVFDESKDAWVFVEFPWLEADDGVIYGKELVKGGVYKSVRGIHENSKIALYVTEWRGKKSLVTVFKGLISVVTGSIFGLRVSTLEFGFEDELLDLEDAWTSTLLDTTSRPDNTMSDESINFRLWRGTAAYPADRDFLRSFEQRGNCLVKPGLWRGLWIVGNHTAPDECDWTVAFSTSTHFSGYGTSTLEGIVERFVFDGKVTENKRIKLYQTFLSSVSVYIFDLLLDSNARLTGCGGAHDEAVPVQFVLEAVAAVVPEVGAEEVSVPAEASQVP